MLVKGNRITYQDPILSYQQWGRISAIYLIPDTDIVAKYEVVDDREGTSNKSYVMPLEILEVNDMAYRELRPRLLDGWRQRKILKWCQKVEQARQRIEYLMHTHHGDARNSIITEVGNLSKRIDVLNRKIRKMKMKLRERYGYNPHDPEIVYSVRKE